MRTKKRSLGYFLVRGMVLVDIPFLGCLVIIASLRGGFSLF